MLIAVIAAFGILKKAVYKSGSADRRGRSKLPL
jgi:hypothetical protein